MAAHLAGGAKLPHNLAGDTAPVPAHRSAAPRASWLVARWSACLRPVAKRDAEPPCHACARPAPDAVAHDAFSKAARDARARRPRHARRMIRCCGSSPAPARPPVRRRSRKRATLATSLAPHIPADARLHVSGCAKGCAHPGPRCDHPGRHSGWIRSCPRRSRARPARRCADLPAKRSSPIPRRAPGGTLMPHAFETDGAAIYRQSFATIRAEADLARFHSRRGAGGGAHDPRRRHGRARSAYPLLTRHGVGRARGAAERRADPLRRAHGHRRHHAHALAGKQRGDLHAR